MENISKEQIINNNEPVEFNFPIISDSSKDNEPVGNSDTFNINDSKIEFIIEFIIEELDKYIKNLNEHEYGLPMYGKHISEMKKIIKNCLINKEIQ